MLNSNRGEFFEGNPREIATEPNEFVVRVNEGLEFGFGEQGGAGDGRSVTPSGTGGKRRQGVEVA